MQYLDKPDLRGRSYSSRVVVAITYYLLAPLPYVVGMVY